MTDWKNTSEVVALKAGTNITITDNGAGVPVINFGNTFASKILICKSPEGSQGSVFPVGSTYAKLTIIGKGGAGADGTFYNYGTGPAHMACGGGGGGGGGVLIAYLFNISGVSYQLQYTADHEMSVSIAVATTGLGTTFTATGGADGAAQLTNPTAAAGGTYSCTIGAGYDSSNFVYHGFNGEDGGVSYGNVNTPDSHSSDAVYFDHGGRGGNSIFGGGAYPQYGEVRKDGTTFGGDGIPYSGGGAAGGGTTTTNGVTFKGGVKTEGMAILEIY